MLLVNGLRQTQKNYNYQAPNNNNFKNPSFQSRADFASFSSTASATKTLGVEVEALVEKTLAQSPNLGKTAKEFMARVDAFLARHNVRLECETIPSYPIRIDHDGNEGEVKNASKAILVDMITGEQICKGIEATGVTENLAKQAMFDAISKGRTSDNRFKTVTFPPDLVDTSREIGIDLDIFHAQWCYIRYDDKAAKAASLKTAYEKLLGTPAFS